MKRVSLSVPRAAWASVLCLLALTAFAAETTELSWEQLAPAGEAFDDPFAALTPEQLSNLSIVARVRERLARDPAQVSQAMAREAEALTAELAAQGVDADALLARREEIRDKRLARATAVDDNLDGKSVRIPGYVLPLEFEDTRVTAFLLVPYVGACIHTPPPPPNQMVHVTMAEGFESKGLFAPVWVEGRMSTEAKRSELYLVDGASAVQSGYTLAATRVAPYEP